MKMTTDIPKNITTPESIDTRLGTLRFFDGHAGLRIVGPAVFLAELDAQT